MPFNVKRLVILVLTIFGVVVLVVFAATGAYFLGEARGRVDMSALGEGALIVEYHVVWEVSQEGPEALRQWLMESTGRQVEALKTMMPLVSPWVQDVVDRLVQEGERFQQTLREDSP